MSMSRRSSIQRRLRRLEQRQANPAAREAFIAPSSLVGETHLVVDGPPVGGRYYFREEPGPGPQLDSFGKFESILQFTEDEANF
jgi:hypothetical protein